MTEQTYRLHKRWYGRGRKSWVVTEDAGLPIDEATTQVMMVRLRAQRMGMMIDYWLEPA